MLQSEVNPFLKGNYGPWRTEGETSNLEVTGELPRDLNGTFYRNGPNPAFEPGGRYHWFDGDGMIHAIHIENGQASYRNRYVASKGLLEERSAGRAIYKGLLEISPTEAPQFKNTGNTNIVFHAGKLLALMEAALPTQMEPRSLQTIGEWDFDGKFYGPMTAHPKMDPESGEMLFFGYSPIPPYLQFHIADRQGRLVRSEPIDLEWPTMMHDFAITKDYVIFLLAPLLFSFEKLAETGNIFSWEPQRGMRIGVMPRAGTSSEVKWFRDDAGYVFHPLNAYNTGSEVVIDACRYGRMLFMNPELNAPVDRDLDSPMLHRWRIDLQKGTLKREQLDDSVAEFPRVDERRVGREHRFGYVAALGPERVHYEAPMFTAIHKHDLEHGTRVERAFGAYNGVGEPLFVPRTASAEEDDGYVLVLAYDHDRDMSEFHVLDARHISAAPIATVRLPHRVPYGFHGNWVDASL